MLCAYFMINALYFHVCHTNFKLFNSQCTQKSIIFAMYINYYQKHFDIYIHFITEFMYIMYRNGELLFLQYHIDQFQIILK